MKASISQPVAVGRKVNLTLHFYPASTPPPFHTRLLLKGNGNWLTDGVYDDGEDFHHVPLFLAWDSHAPTGTVNEWALYPDALK